MRINSGNLNYRVTYHIITLIVVLITFSCKNNTSWENDVRSMHGKEIFIPKELKEWRPSENIQKSYSDKLGRKKIIVLFSKETCTICNVDQLYDWVDIEKQLPNTDFIYILVYNQREEEEIQAIIQDVSTRGRILLDKTNSFVSKNKCISRRPFFHVFSLDKGNKIELVGNPKDSPKLLELYKKYNN